jgi:tellurite resistance protein TerC
MAHRPVELALTLVFVGGKLILADIFNIPPLISLAVVVSILGVAVGASLRRSRSRVSDGA